MDVLEFSSCFTLTFQGLIVGMRILVGTTFAAILLGRAIWPLTVPGTAIVGAGAARLNTSWPGKSGNSCSYSSTGGFWVTVSPKTAPRDPKSKLRPYAARHTRCGNAWYANPSGGAK